MADFFIDANVNRNRDEENKRSKSFFDEVNTGIKQKREEYQEDLDRYNVNIPQEDYDVIKTAIANAAIPEDEAYRWASAFEINRQYNIPLQQAYAQIEDFNAAIWGDKYTFTPKTNFKAIVDNGRLGVNTLKQGNLGSRIMLAEAAGEDITSLLEEYNAIEKENEGLYDYMDRNFAIEALKFGAQSLPFTGYVAGAGILGSLLAPGVGTGAAFAASMANAAGLQYMQLRQAGSTKDAAFGLALLDGSLEAIVETSLGNVAGALGNSALASGAKKAITEKITANLFKRLNYGGVMKNIALRLGSEYVKENFEEGMEEVVQDLISKGTAALAAEIGEYDIDPQTAQSVAKDAWENFYGGLLGSLVLGLPTSALKVRSEIKNYKNVKDAAETIDSKEMYQEVVKDSPIFEGMKEEEIKESTSKIWEQAAEARDAKENEEAESYAEVHKADDNIVNSVENEEGEEEIQPVYRDKDTGTLHTQDDIISDNGDGIIESSYRFGNPSVKDKNLQGYINYTADLNNNTITINDFNVPAGWESVRGEFYDYFAEDHAAFKINWDPQLEEGKSIKTKLTEANPRGTNEGLNYYGSVGQIEAIQTDRNVIKQIDQAYKSIGKTLSTKQLAAHLTVMKSLYKRLKVDLNTAGVKIDTFADWINYTFKDGLIFGDPSKIETQLKQQGQKGVKGFSYARDLNKLNQDIKSLIYVTENGDFSTFTHEIAHIAKQQFTGDILRQAEKAFGVDEGSIWTEEQDEAFAYGFEQFLRTGKAANEDLKNIFQKIAQFLSDCMEAFKAVIKISPEIESFYNELLSKGDKSILREAMKAAEANEKQDQLSAKQEEYRQRNNAAWTKHREEILQTAKEKMKNKQNTTPSNRMGFESVLGLPDSYEKYKVLSHLTMKIGSHGALWQTAVDELHRMDPMYREKLYGGMINSLNKKAIDNTNLTAEQKEEVLNVIDDPEASVGEKENTSMNAAADNQDMPIFQIIGEKGAVAIDDLRGNTFLMDNKQLAKNMETEGKNAREIRLLTGWEKGVDGQWRYEIDDKNFKLTDNNNLQVHKLKDLLDAPELYEAYPEFADYAVDFVFEANNTAGHFSTLTKSITLNLLNLTRSQMKSTLLHEIQHAIQQKEGFATGANTDSIKGRLMYDFLELSRKNSADNSRFEHALHRRAIANYLILSRKLSDKPMYFTKTGYYYEYGSFFGLSKNKARRNEQLNEMIEKWREDMERDLNNSLLRVEDFYKYSDKELRNILKKENYEMDKYLQSHVDFTRADNMLQVLRNADPYQLYKAVAGEVEARNVQFRMDMDPVMRLDTLLSETEDVARDAQHIFYDAIVNSYLEVENQDQLIEEEDVRQMYENTDKWLKAPNDKNTNLTEKQWLQVRTSSFKKWFGDWENDPANASVVLDNNGEPLVVYHGTRAKEDFYVFDTKNEKYKDNIGSHFGPKKTAEDFSKDKIYEVFLNLRKPFRPDFDFFADNYNNAYLEILLQMRNEMQSNEAQNAFDKIYDVYPILKNYDLEDIDILEEFDNDENLEDMKLKPEEYSKHRDSMVDIMWAMMKAEGYDGMVYDNWYEGDYNNQCYVALQPKQIKSATDNIGKYNVNDPDIRFQHEFESEEDREAAITEAKTWIKENLPEKESKRILDNMERLRFDENGEETGYFNMAWESALIRRDRDLIRNGEPLPENSWIRQENEKFIQLQIEKNKERIAKGKPVKKIVNMVAYQALLDGEEGILKYLNEKTMLSNAKKCEKAINGSILNCNPSAACAKYCYVFAKAGHYIGIASVLKSEIVNEYVENNPIEAAKMAARQYYNYKKAGYALRIFDKGDLTEKWLPFLNALNVTHQIRNHVFSKRPELLSELDSGANRLLLSIDSTNEHLAKEYLKLELAAVVGPNDTNILQDYKDRLKVVFIAKGVKGVSPKRTVEIASKLIDKSQLCPVDAFGAKMTCIQCQASGKVGCWKNNQTKAGLNDLLNKNANDIIKAVKEAGVKLEAGHERFINNHKDDPELIHEYLQSIYPQFSEELYKIQFSPSTGGIQSSLRENGNDSTTGHDGEQPEIGLQTEYSEEQEDTDKLDNIIDDSDIRLQKLFTEEVNITSIPEYSDEDHVRAFNDPKYADEMHNNWNKVKSDYKSILNDPAFVAMHVIENDGHEKYIAKSPRGDGKGKWQMSLFDKYGPYSHITFDDLEEAYKRQYELPYYPEKIDVIYNPKIKYDKPYYDAIENNDLVKAAEIAVEYFNKVGYQGPVDTEVTDVTDVLLPLSTRVNNNWYTQKDFNNEGFEYSLLFQTQEELYDEARSFPTWEEFMDYSKTFAGLDEASAVPSTADAQWYQTTWELANGIQPEEATNEKYVQDKLQAEGTAPTAMDAMFIAEMREGTNFDDFMHMVARYASIDLNSAEYQNLKTAEDAEEVERIAAIQDLIQVTMNSEMDQRAINRIAAGGELDVAFRNKLISEITDDFKSRNYRELYAEVMDIPSMKADRNNTAADVLQKRYDETAANYPLALPSRIEVSRLSPQRQKELAETISNVEIAEGLRNGTLKMDNKISRYIKALQKQINEKEKSIQEMLKQIREDTERLTLREQKDLIKLHEDLIKAKAVMDKRNKDMLRKIEKGLKITEKYRKESQNLKHDYNEALRKYEDALAATKITAEVQKALDMQNKLGTALENIEDLKTEQTSMQEIQKIRKNLVKRTMRRVRFDKVDYDYARQVIAIQRIFQPNLIGGVNKWIGQNTPYLRGVISQVLTDKEYRNELTTYLYDNAKGSTAYAEFMEKWRALITAPTYDAGMELYKKWDEKTVSRAALYLPKEDWISELMLKELDKERKESIDLDIELEERREDMRDENGEIIFKNQYDEKGNVIKNPDSLESYKRTMFSVKASDEILKMVKDAVGEDIYQNLLYRPFSDWTTEEMEKLARRVDDLYNKGRDIYEAKKELRKQNNATLRQRIEDTVNNTGIVINEDDTPEEKEKKQKKIDEILGLNSNLKGTNATESNGIKARMNRLLHSYNDASILRVARILDGYSDGTNVNLLYRQEDDCYNLKTRSINGRVNAIEKVMTENNITMSDLAKIVEVKGRQYTIDELLFFAAANEDYVNMDGFDPLDNNLMNNDDFAATSRNAVMFGNMISDTESLKYKQELEKEDEMILARLNDPNLSPEERLNLMDSLLETKPGLKAFIAESKRRYEDILKYVNENMDEKYQKLRDAISKDYADQYDRMNEISIKEFNTPVHRVKCYVPIIRKESNGADNYNQVKEDLLAAMGSGAGKQWVNKGMTKRRINMNPFHQKPVQTGLYKTWANSVERTEHFIAYSAYARQLNDIYKSRDANYVRQYIENRYGRGMITYLDDYINEVANPNALKVREKGSEILHELRGRTASAYLAWKLSGIIKQAATSPWPYMQFVTPKEYMAAAWKIFTSRGSLMDAIENKTGIEKYKTAWKHFFDSNIYDEIRSKSVFMNNRTMDPMADLIDEMAQRADQNKVEKFVNDFNATGMAGLEWIDWAAVAPGWYACYTKKHTELEAAAANAYEATKQKLTDENDNMDFGMPGWKTSEQIEQLAHKAEEEAAARIEIDSVRYADDCTRACQPSNRTTDIAPLFKQGGEFKKAYLQFQTSLNVIWQNLAYDIKATAKSPDVNKQQALKKIMGIITGYVLAGIMMNSIMDGVGGDDDKDGQKADDRLKKLVFYATTQFTDAVPLVGSELTNTMDKIITGKGSYSTSGTDMTPTLTKMLAIMTNTRKGNWAKAAGMTTEGIGMYLGLPVSGTKEVLKLLDIGNDDGEVKLNLGNVYGILNTEDYQ